MLRIVHAELHTVVVPEVELREVAVQAPIIEAPPGRSLTTRRNPAGMSTLPPAVASRRDQIERLSEHAVPRSPRRSRR
jgi:hypothetical protein